MSKARSFLEFLSPPWGKEDELYDFETVGSTLNGILRRFKIPARVSKIDGDEDWVEIYFYSQGKERPVILTYEDDKPVMLFPQDNDTELVVPIDDLIPPMRMWPERGTYRLMEPGEVEGGQLFYLFLEDIPTWFSKEVAENILLILGLTESPDEDDFVNLDAFGNKIESLEEQYRLKWVVRGGKKIKKKFRIRKKRLSSKERLARKLGAKKGAKKRKAKKAMIQRKRKKSLNIRKRSGLR